MWRFLVLVGKQEELSVSQQQDMEIVYLCETDGDLLFALRNRAGDGKSKRGCVDRVYHRRRSFSVTFSFFVFLPQNRILKILEK